MNDDKRECGITQSIVPSTRANIYNTHTCMYIVAFTYMYLHTTQMYNELSTHMYVYVNTHSICCV